MTSQDKAIYMFANSAKVCMKPLGKNLLISYFNLKTIKSDYKV